MTDKTKTCSRCGEEKPSSDFNADRQNKDGLSGYCKDCMSLAVKEARRAREEFDENYKPQDVRKAKLFAFWQSIPSTIKGSKYFKEAKNETLGPDEAEMVDKLVECTNMTEVADVLDVSYRTIRKMKKSNYVQDLTKEYDEQNNVMRFKKDIDYRFTQKVMKSPSASNVETWYKIYMDWVPTSKRKMEHDVGENTIKRMQDQMRELAKKKEDEEIEVEADEGEIVEDNKLLDDNNRAQTSNADDSRGDSRGDRPDQRGPGDSEADSEEPIQGRQREAFRVN